MKRTGRIIASLALAGLTWLPGGAIADPVLTVDRAVQLALEHNSQIVGANAGVLSARAGVYGAYAAVLPHVSASISRSGSQTTNQTGAQVFGGRTIIPSATPEYDSYSTSPGLSASWSVLDLANIAGLSSAQAGLKGAQWSQRATRADVKLLASQQFYSVVQAVRLVEVQANTAKLARDSERRVRALFEVGSVSRNDLLQAQVQTAQSQLDSIAAVQSLLVQRDQLATLIGVEEAGMGVVDTTLSFTPRDYDEGALLKEASENRPDLKAALARLKSARAGLASARYGWLPYVTLSASAAYNPFNSSKTYVAATDTTPSTTISARSESDRQYGGRLALNWDFFDGGTNSARNASARAQLATAQNAYDVLVRNLAGEVHEAALTYRQTLGSEAVAEAAVASATESMKLTQEKYNVGSATILDLITAQVALQRAESQLVNALAAIRVAEARIERARGSGV